MNVEITTPEHGAAFRILYERVQPHMCFTRQRQREIEGELAGVALWASTQPAQVKLAYNWAVRKIIEGLNHQIKQHDMGNAVNEALKTIARPPENTL